eukprot:g7419.t1
MPLQDVTNTLITPVHNRKRRKSSSSFIITNEIKNSSSPDEKEEVDDSHILNRWKESMMELKSTLEQEEMFTAKTPSPLRFLPPSEQSEENEEKKVKTPPPSAIVFRRAVTSACDTVSRSRFRSGLRRLIPILRRRRFSSLDQSFSRWNQFVRIAAIKDRLEHDVEDDDDMEDSLLLPAFSPRAKRSLNMSGNAQEEQEDKITTPLIHREALEDIKDFASTIRAEAKRLYPSPEASEKKRSEKKTKEWSWSSTVVIISHMADFLLKLVTVVIMSTYLYVGGPSSSRGVVISSSDVSSLGARNLVTSSSSSSLPLPTTIVRQMDRMNTGEVDINTGEVKSTATFTEKLNLVSPKNRAVFSTGETPTIEFAFGPQEESSNDDEKSVKLCLSLFRLGLSRFGHKGKAPERTWDSCFMIEAQQDSITKFVPPRFFHGEYELRAVLLDKKILARPKVQFHVQRQRTSVTIHVRR